ncbi:MAG: aldehyde dehydrogenase family protein, partial [Gordonia sp. (in: high G+C Gram-positive bacteria)]|uniref:aldehyde dehydrogenase family protein n=1 Tax=Gordonia sp. (in: high G+C Gram-positive bacteria) TaxID=84139 RepID=UPI003C7258AE
MSAPTTVDVTAVVTELATAAKKAARTLGSLTTADKNAVLLAAAEAIDAASDDILAANAIDVQRAEDQGTESSLVDRLRLTAERVAGITSGLRQVAGLPDPIGEVLSGKTLPNGLELRQVRVPLGVVGFVYEARPNVTVDGFGIAFKSGNAVLLRGSSSAASSNAALVEVLREVLEAHKLNPNAVSLLPSESRDSVTALI